MSDLIDRAEAQTELQIVARRYTLAHEAHGEGTVDWCANLITVTDAMNALRKVPSAQPEQKWIPCSERLPDVAQRVLLSGHGQVMVGMLHSSGKYSLEPTGISYAYPKDDIEAWMPLPEPYMRGEQNETN